MYKPTYTLTPKLVNTLSKIERLYGQLESLRIPRKLELNLERDNLIRSSYISNSIEGNPLSQAEVTNLLLNDRVPANLNEQEVRNYFDILKNLDTFQNKSLSIDLITSLHADLLNRVDHAIAGSIRNKRVVVGGYRKENDRMVFNIKHEPPAHTKIAIEKQLHNLNQWYEQDQQTQLLLKIGSYHHEFVYIHPFEDGNGRVCRLLTALLFLNAEYAINKYFVLDDYYDIDRPQYSDMLHTADAGDKTHLLEYFTEGIYYSLQSAHGRIKTQVDRLSIEDQPSAREKEVLSLFQEQKELTSSIISERLDITRQQAHKLLSNLINKGFLKKKGSTKNSYYLLK